MMPQVNLDTSTIERMKQNAEPLVDTFDTVINKALDAYEQLKKQADLPSERILNPAAPPSLSYTTVKSVTWKGKRLPLGETYWNPIMMLVIREAKKQMTKDEVKALILCNHVDGIKEDNGYKYIADVGVSVQGQDANNAWKTTYNVLKAIKAPMEVIFAWQDNPKAVAPGAMGKFNITWE